MKLLTLPVVGQAVLVFTVPFRTKVYMQNLGPGNVHWGTNKDELENGPLGPAPAAQMGILQAVLAGNIEREWVGDLYAVTDTAGCTVSAVCPAKDHSFRKGVNS